MSRPHHGRRRRRPGRRLRYRGGLPPRPRSYQASGLKAIWDLLLPDIRGRDRRRFFNEVSAGLAVMYGALGAAIGWGLLGPFGVILGLGVGVMLGSDWLSRSGYLRR